MVLIWNCVIFTEKQEIEKLYAVRLPTANISQAYSVVLMPSAAYIESQTHIPNALVANAYIYHIKQVAVVMFYLNITTSIPNAAYTESKTYI